MDNRRLYTELEREEAAMLRAIAAALVEADDPGTQWIPHAEMQAFRGELEQRLKRRRPPAGNGG